jgi:hypothetical protein
VLPYSSPSNRVSEAIVTQELDAFHDASRRFSKVTAIGGTSGLSSLSSPWNKYSTTLAFFVFGSDELDKVCNKDTENTFA